MLASPPDMDDLTPRQQRIIEYIRRTVQDRGYPPTVREIGEAVGLTSSSSVHAQLANLQRKGVLRKDRAKPRAIEVAGARPRGAASVAVPLVANDELLGLLAATGTSEVDLARAVANQTAVAIKKIELIERLTEKNRIKDFFEQLAGGESLPGLEGRAARLGCDLDQRYVVVAATPPSDELERALAAAAPGSLFDRRDDSTRALLRVPFDGHDRLLEDVRELQQQLEAPASIGLSNVCRGAETFAAGFEEARHALLGTTVLQGTPGVMAYEELGPYKYLLRMPFDGGVRDAHRDSVARIAEYDRQRSTALLRTLEEFLRRRGSISATAEALYVHPNTLRQRLRRIGELSGLDLRKDDWLMVEIAVKMVRLQEALGPSSPREG